jgi:hypothetical protein
MPRAPARGSVPSGALPILLPQCGPAPRLVRQHQAVEQVAERSRWSQSRGGSRSARQRPAEPRASQPLHDRLDLDRDVIGQAPHADRGAGVAALAEHLDEQVRAALITAGCCANPGTALTTMPSTLTTRATRSRLPSSGFIAAISCRPASRARRGSERQGRYGHARQARGQPEPPIRPGRLTVGFGPSACEWIPLPAEPGTCRNPPWARWCLRPCTPPCPEPALGDELSDAGERGRDAAAGQLRHRVGPLGVRAPP